MTFSLGTSVFRTPYLIRWTAAEFLVVVGNPSAAAPTTLIQVFGDIKEGKW
jgi:hypothetical protein